MGGKFRSAKLQMEEHIYSSSMGGGNGSIEEDAIGKTY